MSIDTKIILGVMIFIWIYDHMRLKELEKKNTQTLEELQSLKNYLYEIDPQFDDERRLQRELDESVANGTSSLAGAALAELVETKESEGRRTLSTPL